MTKCKNYNWKQKLNEARSEYRAISKTKQPCFNMPKERFNKLMHRYQQLKPELDYKSRVKNLRLIINYTRKKQFTYNSIQFDFVINKKMHSKSDGYRTDVLWIDDIIDNLLADLDSRDIL